MIDEYLRLKSVTVLVSPVLISFICIIFLRTSH